VQAVSLTRFAWLSIGAALATIAFKAAAYIITGSVGLLSDAVESLVNLIGGIMALAMLKVAERPADEDHAYGHSKAEYFASGLEGGLILVAAIAIGIAAALRLLAPRPLEAIGIGLIVSTIAAVINLAVALILLRAGRKHNSITLEANAQHLLTDFWTSAGVLVGVGLVAITKVEWLDPVVALVVTVNIFRTGWRILRRSVQGLMDAALPAEDMTTIRKTLSHYETPEIQFHALRTRQSGARKFMSVHVLVPGAWSVHQGHELLERIESDLGKALPTMVIFTHLESLEDPASWEDQALERPKKTNLPAREN
jgi:cation diffusion facilitator family transporter